MDTDSVTSILRVIKVRAWLYWPFLQRCTASSTDALLFCLHHSGQYLDEIIGLIPCERNDLDCACSLRVLVECASAAVRRSGDSCAAAQKVLCTC